LRLHVEAPKGSGNIPMSITWLKNAVAVWDRIMRTAAYIAASVVIIMMLLIVWDVVVRYLFNSPSRWISDFAAAYLNIWIVMLGSGYVLLRGGHVSVNIVTSRLAISTQTKIKILVGILGLFYSVVMTWEGWYLAVEAWHYTFPVAADLPVFPATISISVGFLFLSVSFVAQIIENGLSLYVES